MTVQWDEISVGGTNSVSPKPDQKTEAEIVDLQAAALEEHIEDRRTDRGQRVQYAKLVYRLVVGWLAAVGFLLLLAGFGKRCGWFVLSDTVLVALVAGTSVNVLGILL